MAWHSRKWLEIFLCSGAAVCLGACDEVPANSPFASPSTPAKAVEAAADDGRSGPGDAIARLEKELDALAVTMPPPDARTVGERNDVADGPDSDQAGADTAQAGQDSLAPWLMDPTLLDSPDAQYFTAVAREIAALRADMERMRQELEEHYGAYTDELRAENERLRRELQLVYAARSSGGRGAPMLPAEPGEVSGDYFASSSLLDESGELAGSEQPDPQRSSPVTEGLERRNGGMAIAATSDVNYAVIAEWGRTPEEAAGLDSGASSLQGMVLVVPDGTTADQLEALGRQLRVDYDEFDNINIQVFDSQKAAEAFYETNSREEGAPVLRVSRHRPSGTDAIHVVVDGQEIKVGP